MNLPKNLKNVDPPKFFFTLPTNLNNVIMLFHNRVMHPKGTHRMANSVDPDQTVLSEDVLQVHSNSERLISNPFI